MVQEPQRKVISTGDADQLTPNLNKPTEPKMVFSRMLLVCLPTQFDSVEEVERKLGRS